MELSKIDDTLFPECEEEDIEFYDCDFELIEFVQKRFGNIRFFGSAGTLPPGYKQCARTAVCYEDSIPVQGFYVAYINPKRNKFTIRYTNEYDPWGVHFLKEYKENNDEKECMKCLKKQST